MDKKKNFQLQPVNGFKITIDALSNEALDTDLNAKEIKKGEIVESRRKKIVSNYKISNVSNSIIQFTEFDRAILDACIAEQSAGNEYTSPERLFHLLGGGHILTEPMRKSIMDSIERLAGVRIEIDMETAQEKIGYGKDKGKSTFRGYLMPTESLEVKINGQPTKSSIHFFKRGIIFSVADMKDQIITLKQSLFAAPIRHSERGIALNHYIVRRTLEIKGSHETHKQNSRIKPLRKIISFETMLKKCGLENADRDTRRKVKNIVEKILKFLVEQETIKSFEFEIGSQGKIHSIILKF